MKKIFTLIATVFLAMSANAQEVGLFDYTEAYVDGQEITTANAKLTLGNDMKGWKVTATKVSADGALADFGKTLTVKTDDGDVEQFSVVTLTGQNNPKDQAESGKGSGVNYSDGKTSGRLPQNGSYFIFHANKGGKVKIGIILNLDKAFYLVDATEAMTSIEGYIEVPLPEANLHNYVMKNDAGKVVELADDNDGKGGKIVAEKVTGTIEFDVVAGHDYYYFCSGSKLGSFGYIFTPSSSDTPVASEVDKYVAISAEGLAPEFAVIVGDGNVATNVVDNNSVVKVELPNITLEAVASATPKDVTKDAITSWNDVKWEKKNQGDISFDYILGTGVCYTSWAYEEIIRDGEPTGEYRILIGNDDNGWPNFYVTDGSHGLPISGLYYKYTPKVNGTLKMGIWMNKGNRRLFVVPSDTKATIDYQVEGYINGQNGEDGKKKYLTNDEIRVLGTDPYVMGAGNQPFWGYVIVGLEAGKDYYIFSQNAQVGFQGFEFTTGGTDGIENVQVVKVQNNKIYNLQGQVVGDDYKGIVIKNGKKFLKK